MSIFEYLKRENEIMRLKALENKNLAEVELRIAAMSSEDVDRLVKEDV